MGYDEMELKIFNEGYAAPRSAQVVSCPNTDEVWLEFGYIKGDNNDHDMLWYNEGRAEEFNFWYRALMTKKTTNEYPGRMYFKMLIRPHCNLEIICEDATDQRPPARLEDGRRVTPVPSGPYVGPNGEIYPMGYTD